MEEQIAEKANQAETKCKECGALLHYSPGTTSLNCQYCGTENTFEVKHESIEEMDFEGFVAEYMSKGDAMQTLSTIHCDSCGSTTTLNPNIVSDSCAFCGSHLSVKAGSTKAIKPKSLLPFSIDKNKGFEEFTKWVKGRWFAPSDLKKYLRHSEKLSGVYIPYWTYDAQTDSSYTGMRGVNRQESYTTTVNGKSVTQTRTVIDWYPCSGYVDRHFDDVLVLASTSLPKSYTEALEPWDLGNLTPFDEKFLSGFRAESYAVDLVKGYEDAKGKMDVLIRQDVNRHIGGQHQRILTLNTTHTDVTFKHILLPVWISAFQYRGKTYRFLVNGRTGEVQGERPYSFWKIFFFVLMCLAVVAGIVLAILHYQK